jgi:hypothetical protein
MAFNADVILLQEKLSEALAKRILSSASQALGGRGITIHKTVPMEEYDKNTTSREINKYIRVKRQVVEEREKEGDTGYDLVKTGKGKYRSEAFASAKYAFVSLSQMGEFSVVWFSFHSRLHRALPRFGEFTEEVTRLVSVGNRVETMVMSATSASRSSDLFALYINGRERSALSGKGALTDVKNTYSIDINTVMDNIDQNLAIFYAPLDFAEVKKDIADQEKRIEAFKAQEMEIKNKEDGTNMVEGFKAENEDIMSTLNERYKLIEKAMRAESIGTVLFFKMEKVSDIGSSLPENERLFGRDV